MVARILSGTSIRGLLHYNEAKVAQGQAKLIFANQFGIDIEKLGFVHKLARFEHLTRLNDRTKVNALHIMLNFDKKDELDTEKLFGISEAYMQKIGFSDQPFLVYRHQDASHPHIHIVTTNIREDGSRLDFHNIGKTLSEEARREIEVRFNLVRAEGRGLKPTQEVKFTNIKSAEYGERATKKSIYNVVTAVLRTYAFSSVAEFNAALNTFSVMLDRGKPGSEMYQRGGMVYSVTDERGRRIGVPIKASALPGRPTLKVLEKKFAKNVLKKKELASSTMKAVEAVISLPDVSTRKEFVSALRQVGIDTRFNVNDSGMTYGLTFVDHRNRAVFKGSELGKTYSASAVLKRLDEKPQVEAMRKNDDVGSSSGNLLKGVNQEVTIKQGSPQDLLEVLLKTDDIPQDMPKRKRKRKKKGHKQPLEINNQIQQ